ncbi:hypothetical protein [Actinoplanes sp. L3-i22]|uniref:hypothetical protein n=1 Tax=Actinoplanes sp. L3-i22 TaxID=2836373 RepID=UPI001C740535|nr:hypothetical protein [Actinoplanes sp. L3-i22]BCY07415.1 hypothetical protein L3i22_025030 [Actinoplanes sp. L3-i22]
MTAISSISNSTNYQVTQAQSAYAGQQKPQDDPMDKIAETLGLSKDALKDQLTNGKSLNDVATGQSVGHEDLIAAIKSGMPSSTAITDDVAEKIAAQQSQGTPPPPPGGPRGENAGLQDSGKLKQVSDMLDMDSQDVTKAATSASSLVSLLQDKGVDFSQLKNVLNRTGDLLDVSA